MHQKDNGETFPAQGNTVHDLITSEHPTDVALLPVPPLPYCEMPQVDQHGEHCIAGQKQAGRSREWLLQEDRLGCIGLEKRCLQAKGEYARGL